MQKAMLLKLSTVLGLCLLALIPLAMVRGILAERQSLRDGVIRAFEAETVGPQILRGPVLVIPYQKTVTETSEERGSSGAGAVEIKHKKHGKRPPVLPARDGRRSMAVRTYRKGGAGYTRRRPTRRTGGSRAASTCRRISVSVRTIHNTSGERPSLVLELAIRVESGPGFR